MNANHGQFYRLVNLSQPFLPSCRCSRHLHVAWASKSVATSCGDRRPWHNSQGAQRLFLTSCHRYALETHGLQADPVRSVPLPPSLLRPTAIRTQLKQWSESHQQQIEADARNGVAQPRGRHLEIPQSLYLDDQAYPTGDDIPIIDEYENRRHDDENLSNRETSVLPGDLVLLSNSSHSSRQIVLCLAKIGPSAFWLHRNGSWSSSNWATRDLASNLGTTIHDFASPEEIAPILEWLPKITLYEKDEFGKITMSEARGSLPGQLVRTLVDRLRDLFTRMKVFRRNHLKSHDNLYASVADEHHFRFLPFDDLVREAFGLHFHELDDAGRMSVYLFITRDRTRICVHQPSPESMLEVLITPKSLDRESQEIAQWSRNYQQASADSVKGHYIRDIISANPIHHFVNKARRIILRSRSIRAPTTLGSLGPSKESRKHKYAGAKVEFPEPFTKHDKMILTFLWDTYARTPRPKLVTINHSIAALIMRAVGSYPKMHLDSRIGRLFLQELGCLAPWAEMSQSSVIMPLPNRKGLISLKTDQQRELVANMAKDWPTSREKGTLPLPDRLAHIRTDLGDLPVLAIDNRATVIRDDGISLEESKEHPGAWWIHVSISHPSAFFDRQHPVAQAAQAMGTSRYDSGKTHWMIDRPVAQLHSLAPGAEAFTVSTLLTDGGTVLDVKVAATRVHNVINLVKQDVDSLMEVSKFEEAQIVIGPDKNWTQQPDQRGGEGEYQLAMKYLPMLKKMRSLLDARYWQRHEEVDTPVDFLIPVLEKEVKISFEEEADRDRIHKSYLYLSDPTIRLVMKRDQDHVKMSDRDISYQGVVTHAMRLCCESFARWMGDRKIPALFNGTEMTSGASISMLNDENMDHKRSGVGLRLPIINVQAHPVPHALLNMQSYCRITSPLRRYPDLMAQWNADSYLLAEAAGTIQPAGSGVGVDFAVPGKEVEEYVRKEYWAIRYSDSQSREAFQHWGFQALFRAFYFQEATLPELWDVEMSSFRFKHQRFPDASARMGALIPLRLRAVFLNSPEQFEMRAKPMQFVPSRLVAVDLLENCVSVMPVGEATDHLQHQFSLVSTPEERQTEQIKKEKTDTGHIHEPESLKI